MQNKGSNLDQLYQCELLHLAFKGSFYKPFFTLPCQIQNTLFYRIDANNQGSLYNWLYFRLFCQKKHIVLFGKVSYLIKGKMNWSPSNVFLKCRCYRIILLSLFFCKISLQMIGECHGKAIIDPLFMVYDNKQMPKNE